MIPHIIFKKTNWWLWIFNSLVILFSVSYGLFAYGYRKGSDKAIDNMTNFCYNGAIVQGTNGKMFMCRGIEVSPEEKKQLDKLQEV